MDVDRGGGRFDSTHLGALPPRSPPIGVNRGKPRWVVEKLCGSAAELHAASTPPTANRTVQVAEVDRRTLVLGSSQPDDVVDEKAVARAGLEVVRRRSGGGAVLLIPDEHVWVDFWIPRGDPLWNDDIRLAALWAGDTWVRAMCSIGVGGVEVHGGGLVGRRWSDLVCFAGLGPAEVSADSRKYVGLSQRRTRHWTRIQTMVHRCFAADQTVAGLRLTGLQRRQATADLEPMVGSVGEEPIAEALIEALPD